MLGNGDVENRFTIGIYAQLQRSYTCKCWDGDKVVSSKPTSLSRPWE